MSGLVVFLIAWRETRKMTPNSFTKKNTRFYFSIVCTVVDGMMSGANFMLLYAAMQGLWEGNIDMPNILRLTVILAGIFALRLLIYGAGYTQGQVGGAAVSKRIRLILGEKMKRIPLSRFTKGQTGDYINVATSDVNSYQTILTHKIGDLIKNIVLSLMLIGFVSTIYLPVGLVLLCADLMLIPALALSFRAVKKYGNEKNAICAQNVSSIVEYITGIQTLRAYGMAGTKNETATANMKAFSDISYVYEKKVIPIGALQGILTWCCMPLVIWLCINPWIAGTLCPVSYLMICLLALFLPKVASSIFVDLTSYKNLAISKHRIEQIMDEKEEALTEQVFRPDNYDIAFENIEFAYILNESVLQDISFSIAEGSFTAIVGNSGSGKSTILNLLSKHYEPQTGTIRIGRQIIKDVPAVQILEHISMVDQDVFLFNDSIWDNIRYACPTATSDEVFMACKLAHCDDFIRRMPQGYDTIAGENGNRLSGGERQRISIARAILKNSPILLLDEATASLDIENELAVKKAILNLLKQKKTVIMIAHTLSVIKNADHILVVSGGRIIEKGTHDHLLKKRGKYFDMWQAERQLL